MEKESGSLRTKNKISFFKIRLNISKLNIALKHQITQLNVNICALRNVYINFFYFKY